MDGKRTYSIVINGVKESTDAVLALNRMLNELENRIQALEKNNIKISGDKSNAGDLKEQVALQKELNQLKKEEAAQQRLAADAYANTMKGMKQNLADLKTVINTTDLGETDSIKNMTKDANELTNKLKKMEEAYGQFGRNVGNYANGVAEGLQKVTINVGGVERTFANARDASRQLGNELKTMAINGEQGTKAFKDMQVAVARLNSDIKDATVSSKAMDNLLDTMQSIASIGSITQGFSALFGFDDDEIEKSIQKLVALQNVMQGIEKINQQINSQEGIGGWLAKGNSMIDSFVAKITGANKAQEALNASTNAGVTASKALTVAEEGQAVATTTATVATKALSVALKTIGIGLVISAIATLITYWKDIYNWFTDTIPALKNLSTWFDKLKAVAIGTGTAIINFLVQPIITLAKVIQDVINGDKIGSDIVNGLKKQYNVIGNFRNGYYKETERQQQAHNDKLNEQQRKANEEWLKDEEAKYGTSHKRTQEYLKKQMALTKKGSAEYKELQRKLWEDERKEREEANKKTKSSSKKTVEDTQRSLSNLELRLMREGLNKKLRQLDEEERQTINKLKENGRKSAEEIRKVQKLYSAIRAKEIGEYLKSIEAQIKQSADNIKNIQFQINIKDIELQLDELKNIVTDVLEDVPTINTFATRLDLQKIIGNIDLGKLENASIFSVLKDDEDEIDEYYKFLEDYLSEKNDVVKKEFERLKEEIGEDNAFKVLGEKFEEEYRNELNIVRSQDLGLLDITKESLKNGEEILAQSFQARINMAAAYYNMTIEELKENLEKQGELNEQKIKEQTEQQREAERDRYSVQMSGLTEQRKIVDEALKAIEERYKVVGLEGIETIKETNEEEYKLYHETFAKGVEIDAQIQDAKRQHKTKMLQITKDGNNAIKKNELDTLEEIRNAQQKFYDQQISNYRDMQSKLNSEISKNPVQNSWGIINISQTKKNYAEIIKASETALNAIKDDRKKLDSDFKNGLIGTEAYNATKNQLNDLETEINNGMKVTKDASKQLAGEFIQSINQYFQVLGQSFQQIMQAVWDYQDYQFDKEQDELDKWNEELDKALDKQEDIIEEHKNNIDSIEDELATARGDRRQHLIDQLNAEISAERAAQKEKQRIEKEQEQAKKREEALEKKRREAEYKRNVMQAFVSWHLSIANGLATQPFLPVGIAMGALATTLGAVQYALVKSQKPYAKGGQLDGGVAQGKRHRDGGIPVLGGRASIEGGEFITNRQTTANNVDLLEFVNSKHRKLNIDDFIDFYSSGKAKKNIISMSPRTKFADGGQIPMLDNTYSFDDRLLEAFEKYADRPSVVSVVDINNKQNDVKRVQALAGLDV